MGLDVYIDRCRKPIIKEDGRRDYEERVEVCYWRKNWDLLGVMRYSDEDYAKDVRMTKEDAERILQHVAHNRDYWDSFRSVESVCEMLDTWDEYVEDGWVYCFNANW